MTSNWCQIKLPTLMVVGGLAFLFGARSRARPIQDFRNLPSPHVEERPLHVLTKGIVTITNVLSHSCLLALYSCTVLFVSGLNPLPQQLSIGVGSSSFSTINCQGPVYKTGKSSYRQSSMSCFDSKGFVFHPVPSGLIGLGGQRHHVSETDNHTCNRHEIFDSFCFHH